MANTSTAVHRDLARASRRGFFIPTVRKVEGALCSAPMANHYDVAADVAVVGVATGSGATRDQATKKAAPSSGPWGLGPHTGRIAGCCYA